MKKLSQKWHFERNASGDVIAVSNASGHEIMLLADERSKSPDQGALFELLNDIIDDDSTNTPSPCKTFQRALRSARLARQGIPTSTNDHETMDVLLQELDRLSMQLYAAARVHKPTKEASSINPYAELPA